MKKVTASIIGIPVLVAALGLLGGCATNTEELQRIEKMAQDAKQAADQANATANKALDTANAAQQEAADAKKCCLENTEKMNRMFEKSNRK